MRAGVVGVVLTALIVVVLVGALVVMLLVMTVLVLVLPLVVANSAGIPVVVAGKLLVVDIVAPVVWIRVKSLS